MKKYLSVILYFLCLFMLCSCGAGAKHSGDSMVDSTKDLAKVTSLEPTKPPSVRKLNLFGKEEAFNYNKTEKAVGVQVHDRDSYIASNGDTTAFDHVTGQLVSYSNQNCKPNDESKKISKEEALKIAQEFIKKHCELSKYTLIGVTYYEQLAYYDVTYSKVILGYETSEGVHAFVTASGEVRSFGYHPYIFDNVTVKEFDKEKIVKELEKQVKEKYKDSLISYEINNQRLALNKDGKVVMDYFVAVKCKVDSMEQSRGERIEVLVN